MKSNEGNTREERIRNILEEMIDRELPEPMFSSDQVVPDFEHHLQAESYAKNLKRIETMTRIINEAYALAQSLDELEIEYREPGGPPPSRTGRHGYIPVALTSVVPRARFAIEEITDWAEAELQQAEAEKEANFLNQGRGRKPDPAPYLVAKDLAHFYMANVKDKPTFGFDGNVPAGRFMRALDQLFRELGIKSSIKGPAKQAIEGLSAADLNRARRRF